MCMAMAMYFLQYMHVEPGYSGPVGVTPASDGPQRIPATALLRTGADRCSTEPHCQRQDTNTTACMYTCPFPVSHMHMYVVRGPHVLLWHSPQTPLKARGCCCKSVHGQPRTVAKLTHTRACDFKAARQVSQSHPHAKRKSRSDITPDPGRHRPQRPCTQGRACAHVNVNVNVNVTTFGS